ncbi:MAG: hypothetical protein Q9217_000824 [Psora testacea]
MCPLPLRIVTQRLTETPTWQLPHVVPILAHHIAQLRGILSVTEGNLRSRDGVEIAVLVHKFKTQVSALLQQKSQEARYAAIILIKAAVEAGGLATLQGVGPWVRGLIGILGRPDSRTSQQLCIITLTRIFVLTKDYPTLVREISTPSLASFINSCLNLTKSKTVQHEQLDLSTLDTVLQAFAELIPLHPGSFRPYLSQVQILVSKHIAPTPSNADPVNAYLATPQPLCEHARRLFVLLHVCAPKNTAGEAWTKSLQEVLASLHQTADLVFRALVEDWTPKTRRANLNTSEARLVGEIVADPRPAYLNLPGWTGIDAGLERLNGLLNTLQLFITTRTSDPVTVPVNEILEVVDRVLSALAPTNKTSGPIRPGIGRYEREALSIGLPRLHVSATHVLLVMISRFGLGLSSVIPSMLEQILWAFDQERTDCDLREASYGFVTQVITLMGPSIPKRLSEALSNVIEHCCEDLLPSSVSRERTAIDPTSNRLRAVDGKVISPDEDLFLNPRQKTPVFSEGPTNVQLAASRLLPLTLTHLPADFLAIHLRIQVDRTALLIAHLEAMLASTMNPPAEQQSNRPTSSILPLLSRRHGGAPEVEALVHPQMPVLQYETRVMGVANSEMDGNVEIRSGSSYRAKPEPRVRGLEMIYDVGSGNAEEHLKPTEAKENGMHESLQPQQPTNETGGPYQSPSQPKQDVLTAGSLSIQKREREPSLSTNNEVGVPSIATSGAHKKPRLEVDEASTQGGEDGEYLADGTIAKPHQGQVTQFENHATTVPDWSTPAAIPLDLSSEESDFEMPPLETGGIINYFGETTSEEEEEEEEEQKDDDR